MAAVAELPKYGVYKNTDIEWLGEIPEHWDIVRFRDVFSFGKRAQYHEGRFAGGWRPLRELWRGSLKIWL